MPSVATAWLTHSLHLPRFLPLRSADLAGLAHSNRTSWHLVPVLQNILPLLEHALLLSVSGLPPTHPGSSPGHCSETGWKATHGLVGSISWLQVHSALPVPEEVQMHTGEQLSHGSWR